MQGILFVFTIFFSKLKKYQVELKYTYLYNFIIKTRCSDVYHLNHSER